MSNDIKKLLNPRDRDIINSSNTINWVPKDPRVIIAPYLEENNREDENVSDLQKKAKKVYDGYGKLIQECKELEDQIEAQVKGVSVSVDPRYALGTRDSVRRLFGTDGTEITFEMYKVCLQELAKIAKENTPSPGDTSK